MAKCNPKTLRGIFGVGRKLGLGIQDLRSMTDNKKHLSLIDEKEAAELLQALRDLQAGEKTGRIWRLYSTSSLAREIKWYASLIAWQEPGGFTAWLKKYFGLERLEWVSSFSQAINIKNALKRMYNEQQKRAVS